ncbi:MAG: hypothetical protein QM817_38160 [Archangium sp.]
MATKKKPAEKKPATKSRAAEKSVAKKSPEASSAKKKSEASVAKKASQASISKKSPEASAAKKSSEASIAKKSAHASEQSVRRNAVTQESQAVSRSARPSAPRKEEISTKRSAHTVESFASTPTPAPKPAPFVPFVMPPPKPLALKEFVEAQSAPSWELRATEPDQMPRPSSLEARLQLNWPALLADGSAIGLERGKLAEAHVVRVNTDGERARLSKPGQFSRITLSADRESVYGVSGDGKIWSFPATADATKATTVFQGTGAVWSVTPLSASRAVIAQEGAIRLLDTSTAFWKELDAVSVKPISIPLVDAVDDGRWIVVGRSPKIHLFAVHKDALVPMQSWVQVEGGVSVVDGRAFLYTAGNLVREEVLNLRAVHGALG